MVPSGNARALQMFLAFVLILTGSAGMVGAHDVPTIQPVDGNVPAVADADLWDRLTGSSSANVLLTGAGAWRDVATDAGHASRIIFDCPDGAAGATGDELARTQGDFTVPGCPIRVVDVPNPLGSPWLDVNPSDPSQVAFFSLHGTVISGGPTERSRQGDSHTTFTSANSGASWHDQPLMSQSRPHPRTTGEFATGAFDSAGNIHIGFLWQSVDDRLDPTESILWLAKAPPMGDASGLVGREANVKNEAYLWPVEVYPRGFVDEFHMARVDPAPDGSSDVDPANMSHTILVGERSRPDNRSDYATPAIPSEERIVAVWPVQNDTASAEEGGLRDYLDIAWTMSVGNDTWAHLNETERIGPCTETGRPAQYYGKLYIPCVVGSGYDARTRAHIGDIDIWSFDPYTGKTEQVSFTGMTGGDPMLTSTSDGYMALVVSDFDEEPVVRISYGWYGQAWLPAGGNIGMLFHRASGDGIAQDARVTAAALSRVEHTLFLVYQERQQVDPPEPDRYDPNHPPRPREYAKTVFALNQCDGVLAASQIPLGDGVMSFHWQAYQREPGTFNDLQDGLVAYRDNDTGEEYLFFAVNDYGSVQYGRIIANEASSPCTVPPPPIVGIGTGVPQALELGTAAGNLAGVGVGVLSAAMIGYLLTVKRRTAQYTTTEDE